MMNDKKNASTKRFKVLVGIFAIVSLSAGANMAFKNKWINLESLNRSDTTAPVVANTDSAPVVASKDPIILAIEEETAKLVTKPRTVVLTSEKALAAEMAIKRGDYATANQIGTEILAQSQLQSWQFYPFNRFMKSMDTKKDDVFLENLNKWLAQNKDSALAYLIRANYYNNVGWDVRGGKYSSKTKESKLNSFHDYLQLASKDALKSIQLDGNNPYAYFILLDIVSGQGNSDEVETTFEAAIKKFPDYYQLYRLRLKTLEPKWGGSIEAMYAFTDRYADKVTDNSPLKLLYVQLYEKLLNTAGSLCYSSNDEEQKECITEVMNKIVKPQLANQVYSALDLYNKTDHYQFSDALEPILTDMVKVSGGEQYAGNILQLAAERMGSQNQMTNNNLGHNNYMIDKITALTWRYKEHYDNAEKKYQEALIDIENMPFPNEEEKTLALADIYEGISKVDEKDNQFVHLIAYQNAAIAMGKDSYPHLKCRAYYNLKQYAEAIKECSIHIDNLADLESRYLRGRSYKALGQIDAGLQDFSVVADSEDDYYRTRAAIQLSIIYADRNDMPNMLATFNNHPYLFDEKTQDKDDLAVAYNNRCYAFMQLNRLQEALDDCTTSLKYDSLPDAYQKQQVLVSKLTPTATPTR